MNIDEIIARLHELEEENSMLKSLLSKHGIAYEKAKPETVVLAQESKKQNSAMHSLSLQEKVDLFHSLFKGREDVFAKRWYSDTSKKSGYQPVCEREWNREFCDKRKHKCAECPNRLFAPLTNEHIYNHLAGKDDYERDVLGVYPIMDNNTCNFLCTDFDDKSCEEGYNEKDLADAGIDVIYRNDLSIQCAIIDKSILWYGNINLLGYNAEDSNVMRLCDPSIATELIDIIYEDNSKQFLYNSSKNLV